MDMSLLQTKMKPATPLPELQTVEDIYRWIDENIGRIKTEERIPAK